MSGTQGIKLRMWYEAWYKESYRAYRHPVRMPICLVWVELTPRERQKYGFPCVRERHNADPRWRFEVHRRIFTIEGFRVDDSTLVSHGLAIQCETLAVENVTLKIN